MNLTIVNINTTIPFWTTEISDNYVNNTKFTAFTTAVDEQYATTITYIYDKTTEYTDQEVEAQEMKDIYQKQ